MWHDGPSLISDSGLRAFLIVITSLPFRNVPLVRPLTTWRGHSAPIHPMRPGVLHCPRSRHRVTSQDPPSACGMDGPVGRLGPGNGTISS